MRWVFAILLSVCLAGCDSRPVTKGDLEREQVDRINFDARLQSRVEDLDREVRDLKRELEYAREDVGRASRGVDAVAQQAARNARVANENAVKAMTERGACGSRLVQVSPGVIKNEKIPCTMKDLKP